MSFRLSSPRICFCLAAVVLSGLLACSVQAQSRRRGRPIEFSEPRSDEVTTNLHQLTSKKDSLKQLEEDLYKPLQSFTPKSSLEGVIAPPARSPAPSAVQSKRAKELLDRRNNWVFMTPEDLLAGPTVEQILKSPEYGKDGQQKQELPAMERFYQRLAAKRAVKNSASQAKDDDLFGLSGKARSPDVSPARDDSNLPLGLRESAQALKTLSEPDTSDDPFARGAMRGSSSDPFGLGTKAQAKEQMLEHKRMMDDYHSLVDPSWHPPIAANQVSPLAGLGAPNQSARQPSAGLPSVSSPAAHKSVEAQMDAVHPLLGPPPLPNVNAQALGQSSTAPAPLRVEAPKVVAPTFAAPRRAF